MDFSYKDKDAKIVESRLKFFLSLMTHKAKVKSQCTLHVLFTTSTN